MTSACVWVPDLATPLCLRETRTTLARHEVMGKQRQIHRLLSSIAKVEAQTSLELVARPTLPMNFRNTEANPQGLQQGRSYTALAY